MTYEGAECNARLTVMYSTLETNVTSANKLAIPRGKKHHTVRGVRAIEEQKVVSVLDRI